MRPTGRPRWFVECAAARQQHLRWIAEQGVHRLPRAFDIAVTPGRREVTRDGRRRTDERQPVNTGEQRENRERLIPRRLEEPNRRPTRLQVLGDPQAELGIQRRAATTARLGLQERTGRETFPHGRHTPGTDGRLTTRHTTRPVSR